MKTKAISTLTYYIIIRIITKNKSYENPVLSLPLLAADNKNKDLGNRFVFEQNSQGQRGWLDFEHLEKEMEDREGH